MRVDAAFWVQQGGDGGVGGADEFLGGYAFGGAGLLFGEEVEEEAVEGAGGADVADGDGVGEGGDFEVGGALEVGDGGFGGLGGEEVVFW